MKPMNPSTHQETPAVVNRRQFLRMAGQTASALTIASALGPAVLTAESPANTVGVGCIGLGRCGGDLLNAGVAAPSFRSVAVWRWTA